MQPSAHLSAAIDILDHILAGEAAEKALLAWSRRARYAGSKDRSAVRDIVFDCLRRRASFSYQTGLSGRGLAIGYAKSKNILDHFSGEGFSPQKLSSEELDNIHRKIEWPDLATAYDFPFTFWGHLERAFGENAKLVASKIQDRAQVDLRVNRLKTTVEEAQDFLARDLIFTEKVENVPYSLVVTKNPRKLKQSRAYLYGWVELQDRSSQIVAEMAGVQEGEILLDYCAGGGGKTLALGAGLKGSGRIDAWDISAARMKEIPTRAARAGLNVNILNEAPRGIYDLVFVDAPCSGSGAWRRSPDSKWTLTKERLSELVQIQREILRNASTLVKFGGRLVYVTCSLFKEENHDIVADFLTSESSFCLAEERQLSPINSGDGFYAAVMRRG